MRPHGQDTSFAPHVGSEKLLLFPINPIQQKLHEKYPQPDQDKTDQKSTITGRCSPPSLYLQPKAVKGDTNKTKTKVLKTWKVNFNEEFVGRFGTL